MIRFTARASRPLASACLALTAAACAGTDPLSVGSDDQAVRATEDEPSLALLAASSQVGGTRPNLAALPKSTDTLAVGDSVQYVPSGSMIRRDVRQYWYTTTPELATVTQSGWVKALTVGTTTVIMVPQQNPHPTAFTRLTVVEPRATMAAPAPPPTSPPPSSPPPVGTGAAPELPRATVDVTMPAQTGRTIAVAAGGNLQAAFDAAQPGDVISLAPGATFRGGFRLPVKSGSGWIVVRTAVPDAALPASGTRMTPARAASANLAKISSPGGQPAIETVPGTAGWRFTGVEITADPGVGGIYSLVMFGTAGPEQDTMAEVPRRLILDRVWLHGTATLDFQRCLLLNSAESAVVDSYVSDCHSRGFDSQAINGSNGPGPYLIQNNHLEGSGMSVMFGGSDQWVPGVVPSDITIRGNFFHKPLAWKGVWQVKTIFELKAGRRILVEGNLFDGVWQDAQTGYAWVLKGATAPTEDITLRRNVVRNAGGGVGFEGNIPNNLVRVRVEGNLFERINVPGSPYQGAGNMTVFGGYNNGGPVDVQIVRNTFGAAGTQNAGGDGINVCMLLASPQLTRLVFSENVCPNIILGDGGHPAIWGLNRYAPGHRVERNLIVGNHLGERDPYPATTLFAATPNEAWTNPASGDWTLRSSAWAGIGAELAPLRAMAAAVLANGN